jgi:hypothetical protein
MIHDLADLEPLLQQYDAGKILVGPLLNLWTNSSFRLFNIAGKGDKIYEIALGFVESEIHAQQRRADVVAALEGRFGEVQIFDSQLEMAQAAHALWANDETARFLATASRESKLRPTREADQKQNLTDPDKISVPPGDRDNGSVDEGASRAVALADAIASALTHAPQSAGDQAEPTRACDPAQLSEPLDPPNVHASLLYSALTQDAVGLAVLRASLTDTIANPGTVAESGANLQTVTNLPVAPAASSVSKKYLTWALSGAYLALCFVVGFFIGTTVFTGTRQAASEAITSRTAAQSITAGNDSSQATGTVTHPISAGSIGTANREAQPTDAAPVTSPSLLTSQPDAARAEAGGAPIPGAQPSQNLSDQTAAAPNEQLTQSPKAQGDQAGGSISPPQSSPSQTANTQSTAALTVPVLIPQPSEVAPVQVRAAPTSELKSAQFSPASTQIMAAHDGPQLLPSEVATPQAPQASAVVPLRPLLQAARELKPDQIAALLKRCSDFLKSGDFGAARLLLRRGVESGSADAALMLGKTFDPFYLHEIRAIGIKPDVAQSRQWYRKAMELGSEAAAQRLANLAQTGQ